MSEPRIDFLIIGAQKAGTTALFRYLVQNPAIFMPPEKELHFFRSHLRDDYAKLHESFDGAIGRKICGEASPVYLFMPEVLKHIAAYRADIRLVASLRHPVLRAYSAWSMERRRGRETLDFSAAIRQGRERVAAGGVLQSLIYSYVERGFYAAQLDHVRAHFASRQVFLLRSDAIVPASPVLDRLQQFLGTVPVPLAPVRDHLMRGTLPPENTASLEADFDYLQDLYLEDMQRLQRDWPLDISDWIAAPPHIPAHFTTGES